MVHVSVHIVNSSAQILMQHLIKIIRYRCSGRGDTIT